MVGGLSYYADHAVTWVDDVEDLPGYYASGGRLLVMKERKLERVRERFPAHVHQRLREGERALLVVTLDEKTHSPAGKRGSSPPNGP